MNVLFIGDIVGQVGRETLFANLANLKEKYQIDLTIVNGENSAHGKGITQKIYNSFIENGVDVVTMGNHTFSNSVILDFINDADKMIRPANQDEDMPGKSAIVLPIKDKRVGVFNVSGEIFMADNVYDSPFNAMETLLKQYPCDIHIVDIHGEATSEKIAFMHYFCNEVEMVVGTHTHVQTADECIYRRCAYISDVGMTGAYDSVLGRDNNEVIKKIVYKERTHFIPAMGPGILCGVVVKFDDQTNEAISIERIQIRP